MDLRITNLLQERAFLLQKRKTLRSSPYTCLRKGRQLKRIDGKINKLEQQLLEELDNAGKLC